MPQSIPRLQSPLAGLTTGQVVQMREHLARHYYPQYRAHVTYPELRDAGQLAIDVTLSAGTTPSDPLTLTTMLYHHIKDAIVEYGQRYQQRSA